jgi:hypothetical protein
MALRMRNIASRAIHVARLLNREFELAPPRLRAAPKRMRARRRQTGKGNRDALELRTTLAPSDSEVAILTDAGLILS